MDSDLGTGNGGLSGLVHRQKKAKIKHGSFPPSSLCKPKWVKRDGKRRNLPSPIGREMESGGIHCEAVNVAACMPLSGAIGDSARVAFSLRQKQVPLLLTN